MSKPDLLDREDVIAALCDSLYALSGSTLAALRTRGLVQQEWVGRGAGRRRDWVLTPAGRTLQDRLCAEQEAATTAHNRRCAVAAERLAQWGTAIAHTPWNSRVAQIHLDLTVDQAEALIAALLGGER